MILGEKDLPHVKEIADLLARGVPGARLVTIPGAGHIVNLDAADAFNKSLLAFLDR